MGGRVDAAVTLVLKARDRLSKVLDRVANKSKSTATRVKASLERINRAARKTQAIMGGMLGSVAITAGMFALSMGARKVTEEFVGMDQALTSAAAKFPEMISRGTKEFEKLEQAARRVGGATEFTSKSAAEGLEFLAMAGFNASQAMSVLPAVVDLATGANMDLARATDIASDALGAFNLQSKDTEVLTANLTRINDVFARTVTSANVTLEDMFETMKDGGPTMTAAGQSVETFAALTGTMGNAGIKASKAGTVLKTMATKLASPVGKSGAMMRKLGISVADSSGNMRDMLDILDDLKAATAKMGTQQRLAAIDTIFGRRAVAGVNVVLATGIDKVREFRHELLAAGGSSSEMAEKMRKGLGVRLKVLQSSLIEVGFKILETFQEAFPNALDDTIDAIQRFDPRPMVEGIKSMVEVGKTIFNFLVKWKPVIIGLVGAFMGLKVALGAATVAMAIMNFVALMNPWLLLIMAIGAVVALLWVYWDDVQKWAEGVVGIFWGMTDEVNLAMSNLAIGIYNAFADSWNWIIELFTSGINTVVGLVGSVSSALGIDFDVAGVQKDLEKFMGAGKLENKKELTFDQVRMARQGAMGLPQTTLAQAEDLRRNSGVDVESLGTGQKATRFAPTLDPETLKNFVPDQTTDINVDVNFKNLMSQFDQMVTVDASAGSTSGLTNTTVNKKRAGAN